MQASDKSATPAAQDRRDWFKRSGLFVAGLSAASALALPTRSFAASMSSDDDVKMLNVALGLEYQAIAAYQVGAESGLLHKPVLAVAVQFQGQHKAHAGILEATIRKLGGNPVEAKKAAAYDFPTDQLKSQADVLRFAAGLEKGAASAYLGTVPQFHERALAKAAASILGDESMHWAILLQALGDNPVPAAFIA